MAAHAGERSVAPTGVVALPIAATCAPACGGDTEGVRREDDIARAPRRLL